MLSHFTNTKYLSKNILKDFGNCAFPYILGENEAMRMPSRNVQNGGKRYIQILHEFF